MTFNNQLKVCFTNKKYLITILTNCKSIFLIEKLGFNLIIGAQNQLPITFCYNTHFFLNND